jgi:hypothetical protein
MAFDEISKVTYVWFVILSDVTVENVLAMVYELSP